MSLVEFTKAARKIEDTRRSTDASTERRARFELEARNRRNMATNLGDMWLNGNTLCNEIPENVCSSSQSWYWLVYMHKVASELKKGSDEQTYEFFISPRDGPVKLWESAVVR